MKRVGTGVVCGLVALCAVSIAAQQPVSAAGKGYVTGNVTFGDTQRPARFATVVLYGVPTSVTTAPKVDPGADEATQLAAGLGALSNLGKTTMLQATTGTDGSFSSTDVPPGDYYAFASASGYVTPLSQVESALAAGADVKKMLPGIPVVHVTADHGSMIDLTLQRGAAISGTLSWDDGSPMTGAIMTVVPAKDGDQKPPTQFALLAAIGMISQLSVTDDLGHFRLSGLASGDYVIKATIQSNNQMGMGSGMSLNRMMGNTPLVLYSPSAFHKSDAKPITVASGQDLRDQNMTLALGGMHSVSGQITSLEDHHGINQAVVKLLDTTDKTFVRSAGVDANGNYTVTFVPPGTYTLKVQDAEDTESVKPSAKEKFTLFSKDKTVRSYEDGTGSVVVADADVTGQNVALKVDSKAKKDSDAISMVVGGSGN